MMEGEERSWNLLRRGARSALSFSIKCPWGFSSSLLLPKADSLDGGCGCDLGGPRTSHNWVHIFHLETIQGKIQTEEE